ncbi:MAG: sigma 54-interacting transcriptional regulator [Clostridiales Family XIII bacterium]|jgi:PAS domain S-box-containing protein|nr:sigma 54-interacting transcriptional regulator [Clostridiales Family XIII bacterium]
MMKQYDKKELTEIIRKYRQSLAEVPFSGPEQRWLRTLTGEENILDILNKLIYFNVELNDIFERSPDSIYITDENGMTQRVNKAFEESTGINREAVRDKNVLALEEEGYFRPSVYGIVIKEKRTISFLQKGKGWTAIATGAPVCDENGKIYRVISNARDLDEIKKITTYMESSPVEEGEDEDEFIVAESKEMKQVLDTAKQVADVDSNVLISGESGVGKGVVARYIHRHSHRKGEAFVEINCGAIPDNLLESELFGYEGGAFTGADKKGKIGLIELADKGTLFLDEIGELPMMLQVKLLNFLQSRNITRVGGTKERALDVRVVAATNRDLSTMVAEGLFRDDLFYRLHVVPIFIPPLRERPEDIYPAAQYFARKYMKRYNKEIEVSDESLSSLLHHRWMGNMRELENYMERMVVMSNSEDIPRNMEQPENHRPKDSTVNHMTIAEMLERYEAEIVRTAYNDNPTTYKLAEALGISQPSASRKIKKYITDAL